MMPSPAHLGNGTHSGLQPVPQWGGMWRDTATANGKAAQSSPRILCQPIRRAHRVEPASRDAGCGEGANWRTVVIAAISGENRDIRHNSAGRRGQEKPAINVLLDDCDGHAHRRLSAYRYQPQCRPHRNLHVGRNPVRHVPVTPHFGRRSLSCRIAPSWRAAEDLLSPQFLSASTWSLPSPLRPIARRVRKDWSLLRRFSDALSVLS